MVAHLKNELKIEFTVEMLNELLDLYANIPLLNVDMVSSTLEYLSKEYELIAYSNGYTEIQNKRLELNGLKKFFSKVYGWDLLPLKPSLAGVKEIVKDGNIEDYIFIGDNIESDIEIPDNLGIETIFLNLKKINKIIIKKYIV